MLYILWTQLSKLEDLLHYFVIYDSKLNICWFETIGWTEANLNNEQLYMISWIIEQLIIKFNNTKNNCYSIYEIRL